MQIVEKYRSAATAARRMALRAEAQLARVQWLEHEAEWLLKAEEREQAIREGRVSDTKYASPSV